jgi:hypothetical protein
MSKPTTSLYIRADTRPLAAAAKRRGYTQTRGAGAGELPSVSQFIGALAAGELVAVGPVMAWRDVTNGLCKALATYDLTDRERESLETILHQIEVEGDFTADD